MNWTEVTGNLHMHTPYSDGKAFHAEIARFARKAGLDFVVVTDHNVLVDGVQGYYGSPEEGYTLLLTGEEVHDRQRLHQNNHCLVYKANAEMVQHSYDPQTLIDAVNEAGGMTFLAHPFDKAIAWMPNDKSIGWVSWDIDGFTGLEIWNYMSSFKESAANPFITAWYVLNPQYAISAPNQETLDKWDELLANGKHVIGIGNSDAHGQRFQFAFLKRTVFPYEFLFRCINTHLLLNGPLQGELEADSQAIYSALRSGRAFISYGLVGDARGFRFTAQGTSEYVTMGETIALGSGVTLQVIAPLKGRIRLIRHGEVLAEETNVENLTFYANQLGAYRVEVWRNYKGKERCWILSNPIYVRTTSL